LIVLIIQDDGGGFNVKAKKKCSKGIGLIGMQERAELIKGTLEIESTADGTTVFVRVPLSFAEKRGSNGK
jgi:two-component system sensor histidine kinase NreB